MTYMPQIKYMFSSMLNTAPVNGGVEPQAKRARVN
jgi:hypothetical protein